MHREREGIPSSQHPENQGKALPDTFLAATSITLRERREKIRILFAIPVQLLPK